MRTAPVTWAQLAAETESLLRAAGVPAAVAEARWLVEEASGLSALKSAGLAATVRGAGRLSQMLERRLSGEPIQYVIGSWPFRGLELLVDRRVLIPRPETEVVAEVALAEAERGGARRGFDPWPVHPTFAAADLGTGSGALALALAAELPDAEVWATDANADALAVASANLATLGLAATRVRLTAGVWYEALPEALRGRLRIMVSNPPYVADAEFEELPPVVRDHEPRDALVPGPRGTEALEALLEGGLQWLEPGGALVLELAPHQAAAMAERARRGGYAGVAVHPDLAGRARVLVARRPDAQT